MLCDGVLFSPGEQNDGWDAGWQGGHGGWHLGSPLGGLSPMEMLLGGMGFMDNPGFAGNNIAFDGACAEELLPRVLLLLMIRLEKRKMKKEAILAAGCHHHGCQVTGLGTAGSLLGD